MFDLSIFFEIVENMPYVVFSPDNLSNSQFDPLVGGFSLNEPIFKEKPLTERPLLS